jgi:hypothetical protein
MGGASETAEPDWIDRVPDAGPRVHDGPTHRPPAGWRERVRLHPVGAIGILIAVYAACVFALRLHDFAGLEPRIDQAGFAHWVRDLARADHFLPDRSAGESWLGALERDRESFVHRFAIRVYNVHHLAFNAVPLGIHLAISSLFGDAYPTQIAASIAGSVCVLLALGTVPLWLARGRRPFAHEVWVGLASLLVASTALYLHLFSAFGVHNYGVAALLAATGLATRWLTSTAGRGILAAALGAVLAVYTHWTNLLLLPLATALALAATVEWGARARVAAALRYAVVVGACVLPAVGLALALDAARSDLIYVTSADPTAVGWRAVIDRAGSWFGTGATLFSWPGLVLGLVGVGAAYRVQQMRLPAMLLLVHFVLWSALPGIAEKRLRTYLYVLPFLALGVGTTLVLACRPVAREIARGRRPGWLDGRWLVAVGSVLLVGWHVGLQLPGLVSDERARRRMPEFWTQYRQGQGTLAPMVAGIEVAIPDGGTLLTWLPQLQDLLAVLGNAERRIEIPPALETMRTRQRAGTLSDYLRRRRISLPREGPLFLAASDDVTETELAAALRGVLGRGVGLVPAYELDVVRSWEAGPAFGRVSLYRVSAHGTAREGLHPALLGGRGGLHEDR